jgi:pimeloyl-ACP methyl ester carboxylesterase
MSAAAAASSSAFVLVHGAWHGAWCWRRVLGPLRDARHLAFAVSLSGVGERAHTPVASITLQTHIDDVVAVVEAEELDRVVLVGHSYAGMVISGAADRLATRLRRLVYLDAIVPLPGECWSSTQAEAVQRERRAGIARDGVIAPPDPAVFGLGGADHAWVTRRQTPHPGGVYDDPVHFDAARWQALARSFIDCDRPALATIDASRRRSREQPGWDLHRIATGHDAMVSAPDELVRILLALV